MVSRTSGEEFKRSIWREVEKPWTRSNAAVILIARGEGEKDLGVGEGGTEELESVEWAERRPMDTSEVPCRNCCD